MLRCPSWRQGKKRKSIHPPSAGMKIRFEAKAETEAQIRSRRKPKSKRKFVRRLISTNCTEGPKRTKGPKDQKGPKGSKDSKGARTHLRLSAFPSKRSTVREAMEAETETKMQRQSQSLTLPETQEPFGGRKVGREQWRDRAAREKRSEAGRFKGQKVGKPYTKLFGPGQRNVSPGPEHAGQEKEDTN